MQNGLRSLVLLFAATVVVVAIAQPASAHYDPFAKSCVKPTGPSAKLKMLAAENVELKKQLQTERERNQEAQGELDKLRMRLLQLSNAAQLRRKLHRSLRKRREALNAMRKHTPPEKDKPVTWYLLFSTPGQIVQKVMSQRANLGEKLDSVHKRLKALKERLTKAVKLETANPEQIKPLPKTLKKSRTLPFPEEFKSDLLDELRKKVRKELSRRLGELTRRTQVLLCRNPNRGAWF